MEKRRPGGLGERKHGSMEGAERSEVLRCRGPVVSGEEDEGGYL